MKKNRIFGMLATATLLVAGACSNDLVDPGTQNGSNAEDNEGGLYLSVLFDLPSAKETRSYTDKPNSSSGGQEVGHDYENSVKSAYIVLAKTDNSFIAAAKSSTIDAVGASGVSYRNTAKFTKTEIDGFYNNLTDEDRDSQTGNCKINVFVFANPTEGLSDVLDNAKLGDDKWYNKLGTYDEKDTPGVGVIWDKDNFLMSNSEICTRTFPGSIDDWTEYTTEATAFNLSGMNNFGRPNEIDNLTAGNIPVERAAARYDIRDGALDGISNDINGENYDINGPNGFKAQTYHVVLDSDVKPLVDVFLGKMSMVNMNKNFYFLRRVSNDGLPTGAGYTLCGPELPWYSNAQGQLLDIPGNYVVDAFAEWKSKTPKNGFSASFNYPFFNDEGVMDNAELSSDGWYTSVIKSVLDNGAADSWQAEDGKGKYRTWRYLTEGTIPGVETQTEGIANGIVFKGLLQPARASVKSDDEFTKKLLESLETSEDGNKLHDNILYEFQNHIYCTWEHIQRMAIYLSLTSIKWNAETNSWDFAINRSTQIYNAVFGTGGFGEVNFTCEKVTNAELDNADFLKPDPSNVLKDDLAADPASANAKYVAWKDAFPGSDDQVEDDEATEMAYFAAFRDAAVGKKIALYQTSYDKDLGGWGYYCYYYYWNRHNDNGDNGVMAPMEFDVVRNNVYKLAVTRIAHLGHPRISANDPNKPTPDTPCEEDDVYITVTCTTLPWVVRENTIIF